MIAEINNKAVDEYSEDQLTGNVFGALRYLQYDLFHQIFADCIEPIDVGKSLSISLPVKSGSDWNSGIKFWPRCGGIEPDLIIIIGNTVVMVEVKYGSGESGDNQLLRQAELLSKQYSTN